MRPLFRAEDAVAGVAERGDDVAVFVKGRVRVMRDVNLYVRVSGGNSFDSLGSGYERKKFDFLISSFLDKVNRRSRASARREGRIDDYAGAVHAVFGEFAIIFVRFEGFLVAIKPYVSDSRRREKGG